MFARVKELFGRGELIKSLTVFNLNAKYKGSFLGIVWSMLKPVLMMLIFTIVFSLIVRFEVAYPYPVFFLCGFLPWNFMSMSLSSANNGFLDHANLIKKVFLPSETFILSICLANLVDLLLAFGICMVFVVAFKVHLAATLLALPVVVLLHFLFVLGVSLILSTANVYFRDVRQMLEVGLLAWFYVSPVLYPIEKVESMSPALVKIYMLNPMATFVPLYRMAILGAGFPSPSQWLVALAWSLGALVVGYAVFLKYEEKFPELV